MGKTKDGYLREAAEAMERLVSRHQAHALEKFMQYAKGELLVLSYLHFKGGTGAAVQPKELSAVSGSSSARIATLLGAMEQKGLVTRELDPKDRRRTIVRLTERGVEKAEAKRAQYYQEMEVVFREMGEKDTRDFLRTTERFMDAVHRCVHLQGGGDAS